jgi:hypothetical protein
MHQQPHVTMMMSTAKAKGRLSKFRTWDTLLHFPARKGTNMCPN